MHEIILDWWQALAGKLSYWTVIGIIGQSLFFMRFFIQWIASERRQESYIPIYFWYFSIIGSIVVLAYGIHEHEPIILLGQGFGTVIYIRNLILIRKQARRNAVP